MPPKGNKDGRVIEENAAALRQAYESTGLNNLQQAQQQGGLPQLPKYRFPLTTQQPNTIHPQQVPARSCPTMHRGPGIPHINYQTQQPPAMQLQQMLPPDRPMRQVHNLPPTRYQLQQQNLNMTHKGSETPSHGVTPPHPSMQRTGPLTMLLTPQENQYILANPFMRPRIETQQQIPTLNIGMQDLRDRVNRQLESLQLQSRRGMTPSRYHIDQMVSYPDYMLPTQNQGQQATGGIMTQAMANASEQHGHQVQRHQHQSPSDHVQTNAQLSLGRGILPFPSQIQHSRAPIQALNDQGYANVQYNDAAGLAQGHGQRGGVPPDRQDRQPYSQRNAAAAIGEGMAQHRIDYTGYLRWASLQPNATSSPMQGDVQQNLAQQAHSVATRSNAGYGSAPAQVYHSNMSQSSIPYSIQSTQSSSGRGTLQVSQNRRLENSNVNPHTKQEPAEPRILTGKNDSLKILRTMSIRPQPITTLTSDPNFLPTHVDKDGRPVNLKRQMRSLAQAGGFGRIQSPNHCILCSIAFGEQNPFGAHGVNVKISKDNSQWVDINNFGAVEVPVRLPCSHIVGSNCIIPYFFCPQCQASLIYSGCGHKILFRPVGSDEIENQVKAPEFPLKCTQCRVCAEEYRHGLPTLLSEVAHLKSMLEALSGPENQEQRRRVQIQIDEKQKKIAGIKAYTDDMIMAARIGGYE